MLDFLNDISSSTTKSLFLLIICLFLASKIIIPIVSKYIKTNLTFTDIETDKESKEEISDDKINKLVDDLIKKSLRENNKDLESKFDDKLKLMDEILSSYNFNNESLEPLKNFIKNSINSISLQVMDELDDSLESPLNMVTQRIDEHLKNSLEFANLLKIAREQLKRDDEKKASENYTSILDREYRNAIRFKGVMINLFIVVNLLLILMIFSFILLKSISPLPSEFKYPLELAMSLSGIYLSFGAFVIYVVKFSNSRTLTIISLQEDFYKQDIISKVLVKSIEKDNVNEHDVSIIKNLLSNKSQHEQKTKHPYEILLSGVSNSNIQFKGGKFEVSKTESKTPQS